MSAAEYGTPEWREDVDARLAELAASSARLNFLREMASLTEDGFAADARWLLELDKEMEHG